MDTRLVKLGQQQQEGVNIHSPGPLFHKVTLGQNPHHFLLDGKVFRQFDFLRFAMNAVILLQHAQNGVRLEAGAQSLVLSRERDASQRIPLFEVDRRWRITRFDTHD